MNLCVALYNNGKKKGLKCGSKTKDNNMFCGRHIKKDNCGKISKYKYIGTFIMDEEYINKIRAELIRIINTPQPVQRTKEWYDMRETRLTASDAATALDITEYEIDLADRGIIEIKRNKPDAIKKIKEQKVGDNCNPYSSLWELIMKKCNYTSFSGNKFTRWGNKYETVATHIYEAREGVTVKEFGLLPHKTLDFLAASPDGIEIDGKLPSRLPGRMLEIKCPSTRKITGIPPLYYWIQMQIQMEVCDLDECDFEECLLMEYDDEDSYKADKGASDGYNSLNLEKGVVVEVETEGSEDLKYIYPPMGSLDVINTWITEWWLEEVKKEPDAWMYGKKKIRKTYWGLKQYSCVLVKRDKVWFARSVDKLRNIWNEILECRKMNYEQLCKKYNRGPKPDYPITIKTAGITTSSAPVINNKTSLSFFNKSPFGSSKFMIRKTDD